MPKRHERDCFDGAGASSPERAVEVARKVRRGCAASHVSDPERALSFVKALIDVSCYLAEMADGDPSSLSLDDGEHLCELQRLVEQSHVCTSQIGLTVTLDDKADLIKTLLLCSAMCRVLLAWIHDDTWDITLEATAQWLSVLRIPLEGLWRRGRARKLAIESNNRFEAILPLYDSAVVVGADQVLQNLAAKQPTDVFTGDANLRVLRTLLSRIDAAGYERSTQQVRFHAAFEEACGRILYKDDFEVSFDAICKGNKWKDPSSEVLISTPRRFGKTFSVAQFSACLALTCKQEIVIFSPARRASAAILSRIRQFIDVLQMTHMLVESNQEQVRLKTVTGAVSTIRSFPSKVAVRSALTSLLPLPLSQPPLPAHLDSAHTHDTWVQTLSTRHRQDGHKNRSTSLCPKFNEKLYQHRLACCGPQLTR